jgi:hypothetical protein
MCNCGCPGEALGRFIGYGYLKQLLGCQDFYRGFSSMQEAWGLPFPLSAQAVRARDCRGIPPRDSKSIAIHERLLFLEKLGRFQRQISSNEVPKQGPWDKIWATTIYSSGSM